MSPSPILYAATSKDPTFQRKTWHKGNPSLKYLPALLEEMIEEAKEAKRAPSLLAQFKALRLNMGTSDVERLTLLDADTWQGLAAFSAVTCYWPETGALRTLAAFPNKPNLQERAERDAVGNLYQTMYERGEITLAGSRVVDVPQLLGEAWECFGEPGTIASDRFRQNEIIQALESANM